MIRCPSCGRDNDNNARFCSSCGSALTSPVLKPPPSVRTIVPVGPQTGALAAMPPTGPMPMPMGPYVPRQIPGIGTCYFHKELPAFYVCARCGKATCYDCTKMYEALPLCADCYWTYGRRPSRFSYY